MYHVVTCCVTCCLPTINRGRARAGEFNIPLKGNRRGMYHVARSVPATELRPEFSFCQGAAPPNTPRFRCARFPDVLLCRYGSGKGAVEDTVARVPAVMEPEAPPVKPWVGQDPRSRIQPEHLTVEAAPTYVSALPVSVLVHPGHLSRADGYGRPVSRARVNLLLTKSGGFSLAKCGALLVSLRADGRHYVIDGNHRLDAAKRTGLTVVPALIWEGLSIEEEAALFHAQETRTQLTPLDIHRAGLVANRPEDVDLETICLEFGISITGKVQGSFQTSAISALKAIVRQTGGSVRLRRALNVLCQSYNGERKALSAAMIGGLDYLIRYRGDVIDDQRLIATLRSKSSPERIIATAATMRSALNSQALPAAVASVIVELYNAGLRSRRIERL